MSDPLVISYVAGYTFAEGEVLTIAKLNELARPTINLSGSVGTALVDDGSITVNKLADGALAATDTGRGKMADGYFSADATGRGKFTAGFFGAGDATSIGLFADGFWTADATGRGKFAAGIVDSTLINATVAPTIGSARNLVALNNAGTPASKVDITADEVVLKDSGGKPFLATSVSLTVNIAASGANGLDTGSEAGSVWYYIWVIYNATTVTVASLLSTSATAPTLPSGYTFKALVGVVRNDGSSNFVSFFQQDRECFMADTVVFTAKTGVTSLTALAGADLTAFQALVPPIAKQCWGAAGNTNANGGMALAADANGLGLMIACVGGPSGNSINSYQLAGNWRVALKTSQTLYYIMAATTAAHRLSVSGFKI